MDQTSTQEAAFERYLEELDALAERGFKELGIATLYVASRFDPFDGPDGSEPIRMGYRGGRITALGAANWSASELLDFDGEEE